MDELDGEMNKGVQYKLHPLEKWLRRIAWICAISFAIFFGLASIDGIDTARNVTTYNTMLLDIGIFFGMIFILTLLPAILWLKYGRSYMKKNFKDIIEEIEKR